MNSLNYFNPYKNQKSHWENTLTRAFLVTLKYIPTVQYILTDLIREKQTDIQPENKIPSLSSSEIEMKIDCQTRSFINDSGKLISVCLADEEINKKDEIREADRHNAVYDGVLSLGDGYTVLIEDKPNAGKVWRDQLNPSKHSLEGKNDIKLIGPPIGISWMEIIERLNAILRKGILNYSENLLLNDFFEFIDHNFSYLKPYKKISLCGKDTQLLDNRCSNILEEIGNVNYHRGWRKYLECNGICRMVTLVSEEKDSDLFIKLEMLPGNTIKTAKELLSNVKIDEIQECRKQGWNIYPDFHIGSSFKNFFWSGIDMDVVDYIDYWRNNLGDIKQHNSDIPDKTNFVDTINQLLKSKMITQQGYSELDKSLINSQRSIMRIIPGIGLTYRWSLKYAKALDEQGIFTKIVKEQIEKVFTCWGQSMDSITTNTEA